MNHEYKLKSLVQMLNHLIRLGTIDSDSSKTTLDKTQVHEKLMQWFNNHCADALYSFIDHQKIEIIPAKFNKLYSVFGDVSIDNERGTKAVVLPYSMPKLEFSNDISDDDYQTIFRQTLDDFQIKTKALNFVSYDHFYHLLYPIFKAFTVNLPAFDMDQNTTISLFEQYKSNVVFDHNDDVYIIDFDLSGVQNFIYKVTEGGESKKKVAKTVRGRSFYLSLLSDFVGYAILNHFNLPYENLLISTGGKGTVAISKSLCSHDEIHQLLSHIEKVLFEKHQTELSVSFTVKLLTKEKLLRYDASQLLDIDLELSSSKKQKFRHVLKELNQQDLSHHDHRCELCDRAIDEKYTTCNVCHEALNISDALSSHQNMTASFIFSDEDNDKESITFKGLGYIRFTMPVAYQENAYYITYNDSVIGETKYYANVFASGKSFSEIAQKSEGDPKLFVLKMDVDSLGMIFLRSIENHPLRYLKYSVLSRMLDFFFTNHLAMICSKEVYQNSIYISYAGGDDLVIIGPASKSLDLLEDINLSFKKYVSNHPHIHISAGIEIFHHKSPFRQAVKFADHHLDESKSVSGKDSFTLLNATLRNDKISNVCQEINWFKECYNRGIISKNLIQRLYQSLDESLDYDNYVMNFYRYVPYLSYLIERNVQNHNKSEKQRLKQLFVTIDITEEKIKVYYIVLGMVLLSTRGANHKEEIA